MKRVLSILFLLLFDLSAIVISLEFSIIIRREVFLHFTYFPEFLDNGISTYWWIFPIYLFFFAYEGLLTERFTFWDEIKHIWKAVFLSTIATFSILFLGKIGIKYSRTLIVLMGATSFFIIPSIRLSAKRLLIATGIFTNKVIILGAGKTGQLVAKALRDEKNFGYKVTGFLDDDPEKVGKRIEGLKVHKGVDKVERYIGRSGINSIIIAMPDAEKERLNHLINNLQHKAENIIFVPDILGIAVLGTKIQHFFREQAFALEIQNNLAKPLNILLKRCFDFAFGSIFLLFFLLPFILISLLIRIDSPGSPIFSQIRVGKNGKHFKCYKFRTMYEDAEEKLSELLNANEDLKKEWEHTWKIKDDPRVTRIGKFLRRTSLDELPQLINVLSGDMSIVGPRPYLPKELDSLKNHVAIIHNVLPGITGLWQVSGRSNTSYDYRIALDSWYVRNWNLWLDIVIIFKTIKVILKMEGAY